MSKKDTDAVAVAVAVAVGVAVAVFASHTRLQVIQLVGGNSRSSPTLTRAGLESNYDLNHATHSQINSPTLNSQLATPRLSTTMRLLFLLLLRS